MYHNCTNALLSAPSLVIVVRAKWIHKSGSVLPRRNSSTRWPSSPRKRGCSCSRWCRLAVSPQRWVSRHKLQQQRVPASPRHLHVVWMYSTQRGGSVGKSSGPYTSQTGQLLLPYNFNFSFKQLQWNCSCQTRLRHFGSCYALIYRFPFVFIQPPKACTEPCNRVFMYAGPTLHLKPSAVRNLISLCEFKPETVSFLFWQCFRAFKVTDVVK